MKSPKCQGDFRLRHFCYPRKTARPENLQTETRARPNRRIICTQTFLYSPFNFFCRADPAGSVSGAAYLRIRAGETAKKRISRRTAENIFKFMRQKDKGVLGNVKSKNLRKAGARFAPDLV